MTFTIRALQEKDQWEWRALWVQYNAFYGRVGETALPEEVVQTTWQRLLSPEEVMFGVVGEMQLGKLVGLLHYVFHRNFIQVADTCYVQDVFTLPECRGQGVARGLFSSVERACSAHGVTDLYWHTHSSNAAARALYEQIGTDTNFGVYRRTLT
mmetsp:Transcript_33186/g.63638  ORF Transcript_33186/g.63638 Transcript_33186/m.63638 type:complete len:154 (+) Transcript_33186:803-1264(+)